MDGWMGSWVGVYVYVDVDVYVGCVLGNSSTITCACTVGRVGVLVVVYKAL